jgi:hypothetical protein
LSGAAVFGLLLRNSKNARPNTSAGWHTTSHLDNGRGPLTYRKLSWEENHAYALRQHHSLGCFGGVFLTGTTQLCLLPWTGGRYAFSLQQSFGMALGQLLIDHSVS